MELKGLFHYWLESEGYEPTEMFSKIVVFTSNSEREIYFRVNPPKVHAIAFLGNGKKHRVSFDARHPDFFEKIEILLKKWR